MEFETLKKEFKKIITTVYDERRMSLNDRRFCSVTGAQWEGAYKRQFENKPMVEVNKIPISVNRILSDFNENKMTVKFLSKAGIENDELANVCTKLYRSDEQDSLSEEAYTNAFTEALEGGFGAWRLYAEYEDEINEYQRIRFDPIYDADTNVFFDIGAKRQDKSDAKFCFVLVALTKNEYEEKWGNNPTSLFKDITESEYDWSSPDYVYIAEAYVVEEYEDTFRIFETENESKSYSKTYLEENPSIGLNLLSHGAKLTGEKKITRKRIHKFIISGSEILADEGYIPGENIPIVVTYGTRRFVDGVERFYGHVRLAKDSQRLNNIQISKLVEIGSKSSTEKPIFTPQQVEGHVRAWSEDNIKEYPFLLINTLTGANGEEAPVGPLGYVKAPSIPPALAALIEVTNNDMNYLLGNEQKAEEIVPNVSGIVVEKIQSRIDKKSRIYFYNFVKALRRCGEIWLGMAKNIYVETDRVMSGVDFTDRISKITLNSIETDESGAQVYQNDLSRADFKVRSSVGPSSDTERQAINRNLLTALGMAKDQETVTILTSLILMNMEGEGIADARNFFRFRLVKMGVLPPTEEDMKILSQQSEQQDPNTLYLQAAAANEEAKAQEAQASIAVKVADADKKKAETMKILGEIKNE